MMRSVLGGIAAALGITALLSLLGINGAGISSLITGLLLAVVVFCCAHVPDAPSSLKLQVAQLDPIRLINSVRLIWSRLCSASRILLPSKTGNSRRGCS